METIKLSLVFLCLFAFVNVKAQQGCTDPHAINYDPQATENDGSCQYENTVYIPQTVTDLAANLTECSGLAYFNNQLWTHLDGGNPDQIYVLDTLLGTISQTVAISNADNLDWEDLAEDEDHIYIGDFGNNFGNRTNLRIYKIKKTDLLAGTPMPEVIDFSFSDQTDFTPAQNANNFDCEAFFYYQDSLHLFSKNWVDFKSRHYVLAATPGVQIASLRDSLNVQGQITAADISEDSVAVLLGYNTTTLETFCWLLYDFSGSQVFSGNKRRISLGSAVLNGQVEGLTFNGPQSGYICSEQLTSFVPPKLLAFDFSQFLGDPVAVSSVPVPGFFSVFPNPTSSELRIRQQTDRLQSAHFQVVDQYGRIVLQKKTEALSAGQDFLLDVSGLPNGMYVLMMENGSIQSSKVFVKLGF